MREVLTKCWQMVGVDARGRWLLILMFAFILSAFEAVSALLLFTLLSLIGGTEGGLTLPVLGDLQGMLPEWDDRTLSLVIVGFIVVFFMFRAVLMVAQAYVEARVVENAGARLAIRLLRGYLALPYAYHLMRNSSQLIRNAYRTVQEVVRAALDPMLKAVSDGVLGLGLITVLLITAPKAALLAVLVLGPLVFVLLRIVHPRLKRQGRINQELEKATLQTLQQTLAGIRDIKVSGRERFFLRDFARGRQRLARVHYFSAALRAVPRVGLETTLVALVAVFFGAITLLEGSPGEALPVLGLFAYAAFRLKQPLKTVLRGVNALRFAGPAIDDVYEDLKLGEAALDRAERAQAITPVRFRDRIEFDDVSFRYEGSHESALQNINLVIGRGQSIGLVGPTGGGKSTLMDLLLGLLEPTQGAVRVDGVDIAEQSRAWQRNLGMVPQSVFLVDDTIRRNIALGIEDEDIDEEQVRRVVAMVQLEGMVRSLPKGLDTVTGERGVRLSGGQRQRIAIARALYRDPEVLILDEGTSALDNATEAALMETLEQLRGSLTLITVAHRLSTVRHCDLIVVIDRGRIADSGSYEDLVRDSQLFRNLARSNVVSTA